MLMIISKAMITKAVSHTGIPLYWALRYVPAATDSVATPITHASQ